MPVHDWKLALEPENAVIDIHPQAHVFWDGARFWLFLDVKISGVWKTCYFSTTDGVNFTSPTPHISGLANVKIWFDGNYFYTVWIHGAGLPYTLKFSRGERDGENINWSGPYDVASGMMYECHVTADAGGYPIIGYVGPGSGSILHGFVEYGTENDGTWVKDANPKMDLGQRIWPFAVGFVNGELWVIARDGYSINNGNAVPLRAYRWVEGIATQYYASGFTMHTGWIMWLARGSHFEVAYYNQTFQSSRRGDYLPRYTFFDVDSLAWQSQQLLSDVPVSLATGSTYYIYCQLSLLKQNVLRFAWAQYGTSTSPYIYYTHVKYGKATGVTGTITLPFYVRYGVASLYDAQDGYPMLVVNNTDNKVYFSSGDWEYP